MSGLTVLSDAITQFALPFPAKLKKEAEVTSWLEANEHIWEKFHPKDVYNMDETGIFLQHDAGQNTSPKRSKERLTAALCTNMDGSDKMKLVIVGKF